MAPFDRPRTSSYLRFTVTTAVRQACSQGEVGRVGDPLLSLKDALSADCPVVQHNRHSSAVR